MQIILQTEEYGGFVRFRSVQRLDPETRMEAQSSFYDYQRRGVILNDSFEDTRWRLTNQLHSFTLDFSMDAALYHKNAEPWVGCTAECYQECMKAFIALQLGKYTLTYLQQIVNALSLLAGKTAEDAKSFASVECPQIIGFLTLIPESNDWRDQVIEALEERKWGCRNQHPRQLSEFIYYLRFNKALDDFWVLAAQDEKRMFFPVYFWWKLTAILPLRCTEFLLTPRSCIRRDNGKYLLSIRRTKLKKGQRQLTYEVRHDYSVHEYEIPEWLFEEIRRYQNATKDAPHLPELETLLVPNRSVPCGYYSYIQLAHCLRRFCKNVMNDEDYPIHIGDTRHLAMINLMLSGGSPVICRELAGHESIDVSSNYYANLSSIVESVVYERCRGWTGTSLLEGTLRFPVALPKDRIRVDRGWCDAVEVERGDISECLKCFGTGGQIGSCVNCSHFYADSPGLRAQIEKSCKKAVDEDGRFVMQMIEQVRKGLGYKEDIAAALLRLQSSGYRYGRILFNHHMEDCNGKA